MTQTRARWLLTPTLHPLGHLAILKDLYPWPSGLPTNGIRKEIFFTKFSFNFCEVNYFPFCFCLVCFGGGGRIQLNNKTSILALCGFARFSLPFVLFGKTVIFELRIIQSDIIMSSLSDVDQ